ncbi:MAG TPA: VWA domain-containing protein, partial [Campylobacterales bacterium]|nr:VWA domain-containing protein [Campylobacterales bacterium]
MKKLLLSFILMFTTIYTTVWAEETPQAVIVFDASGSMWGQVDGVNKITIAKDALNKVVNEWNPDVKLGLTVYGHRKKGDCNDIESVVP